VKRRYKGITVEGMKKEKSSRTTEDPAGFPSFL